MKVKPRLGLYVVWPVNGLGQYRDVNETFSFETETFESLFETKTRLSQIFPRPRPSILASRHDRDLTRLRSRRFSRCRNANGTAC